MNKSKSEHEWWDHSWNPVVGCSPVSAGCANCYAAAMSKRFGWRWGSAQFMPDRLGKPAKVKKPGRVFVCSMADLGHETVRHEWRDDIYAAMRLSPQHTYIILTKRPGDWMRRIPSGTWIGVTAENQRTAEERVPVLLGIEAAVRFVSVEPMLERVMLGEWLGPIFPNACPPEAGLSWVIAGPETGPKARPYSRDWFDELAARCKTAGVPFFDKRKFGWYRREWPK